MALLKRSDFSDGLSWSQKPDFIYEGLRDIESKIDSNDAKVYTPQFHLVVNTTFNIPAGVKGFSVHNIDSPTCTVGGVSLPLGGICNCFPAEGGLAAQVAVVTATAAKNVMVTVIP